ncbi:type II toxin-antitoxin system HicB family antitoxin [Halorubrum trueperi]|uniref:Type II toxin-antitoxin system HicB family antitoxin n=1 Tax=Halorubrum trueperi TaxID=2004704 RepID=A0ABD5UDW2_9EURY
MATSTRAGDDHADEIRCWRTDEWWIAKDVETGVTTHGPARGTVLETLDDAIARYHGATGREPTDAEFQAMGIDPADNTTGDQQPPDVLE